MNIGRVQYRSGKEKGLASLQGLDFTSVFGSPTWARTRDLRINRLPLKLPANPHESSLSVPEVSNMRRCGCPVDAPDKPCEHHWILDDSVHMIQLTAGASLASLMLLGVRLNVDSKGGQGARMPSVPLNVSDAIQSRLPGSYRSPARPGHEKTTVYVTFRVANLSWGCGSLAVSYSTLTLALLTIAPHF